MLMILDVVSLVLLLKSRRARARAHATHDHVAYEKACRSVRVWGWVLGIVVTLDLTLVLLILSNS